MRRGYKINLDSGVDAKMSVQFETLKGRVVEYSVVLLLATPFGVETIRVYDAAHGFNEMHRYTRHGGKQNGVVFSRGTLGEGMRAAIKSVARGHLEMIDGWKGGHGRGDEEL